MSCMSLCSEVWRLPPSASLPWFVFLFPSFPLSLPPAVPTLPLPLLTPALPLCCHHVSLTLFLCVRVYPLLQILLSLSSSTGRKHVLSHKIDWFLQRWDVSGLLLWRQLCPQKGRSGALWGPLQNTFLGAEGTLSHPTPAEFPQASQPQGGRLLWAPRLRKMRARENESCCVRKEAATGGVTPPAPPQDTPPPKCCLSPHGAEAHSVPRMGQVRATSLLP